jgi:hypothetical protein
MTELCELAQKYGSDKCPQIRHHYTPFYYNFFKDKRLSIKKVLEIGTGWENTMRHSGDSYQTGAGIRMWRDFFPNAMVYGIDIAPQALFEDERIKTFMVDETDKQSLLRVMAQIGSFDIDLVIDDGDHRHRIQRQVCEDIMPVLKSDVIYIIEDCFRCTTISKELGRSGYQCSVPELPGQTRHEKLIIVKNKNYVVDSNSIV